MTIVKENNFFSGDIYNPEAALTVFKKANHYFSNDDLIKASRLYNEISDANDNAAFNLGYIFAKNSDLTNLRFLYQKSECKDQLDSLFSLFESKKNISTTDSKINNPLVSIIIPVHNSSFYLKNCLETVTQQSYKNLEIFIINDGSSDESPKIIKEFLDQDKRIKFINLPIASGNPGKPRNIAIKQAKGLYTLFIDSDDYIELDYVEKFIKTAEIHPDSDVILASGYVICDPEKQFKFKYDNNKINDFKHPLYRYHESSTIWDKIYKTEFLIKNNIELAEIKAGGDVIFILKTYFYANDIALCPDNSGYYYRRESNTSITRNIRKNNNGDIEFKACHIIDEWANSENIDHAFKNLIDLKKVICYLYALKIMDEQFIDAYKKKIAKEFLSVNQDIILKYFDLLNRTEYKAIFLEIINNNSIKKTITTQPKISVIIPIHNVEDYLENCLDSVINQTLKDIEIVLINDGSIDNSLNIIHDYMLKDDRIVLINNTEASGNSGTPRNQGIYKARGEYIAFVDSDDWIDLNMFELLYARGLKSKSDIVCSGGFYRENADGTTTVEKIVNSRYIPTESKRSKLFLSSHFPIVWYRIYNREMILDNHILFGEVRTSADLPFAFKSLLKANKVDKIENIFYHYRFGRPGSTIERRQGTGAFEMYKSYANIVDYLQKHDLYKDYIPFVIHKAVGDYYYNSKFLSEDYKGEFKEKLANLVNPHVGNIPDLNIFSENSRKFINSLKTYNNPNGGKSILPSEVRPALSIIIPCYNVEKYLSRCLDSILKQSLENFEIIIINDGSTDNTLQVIKNYYALDSRIKVINNSLASGNAGTPRNMGMCVAKGEYLGFVDADDWITPSMFAKLYEAAKNEDADIVSQTGFHRHDGKTAVMQKINYNEISMPSDREKAFESNYFSNIWNRIYKTELIKGNNIYFPRIYLAEDMSFSFVAHAIAKKTKAVKGSWYFYNYNRKDSTTELRMGRKGFEILQSFNDVSKYFKSFKIYDQYASHLVYKKINSLWYTYDRMEKDLKDEFLSEMKVLYKDSLSPYINKKLFTENELKKLNLLEI